jgi:hypothetical protein
VCVRARARVCVRVCVCVRVRVNNTHIIQHVTKLIVASHSFVKAPGMEYIAATSTINFSSCLLVRSSCLRSAQ